VGGYDAIRVYLWAGYDANRGPLAQPILDSLGGMATATASGGFPPEGGLHWAPLKGTVPSVFSCTGSTFRHSTSLGWPSYNSVHLPVLSWRSRALKGQIGTGLLRLYA
jgi:endoglucanase